MRNAPNTACKPIAWVTIAQTKATSQGRRRRHAETSAPAAIAVATAAATGIVSASAKVDAPNRLERVRLRTGKAARLARLVVGGGSGGTPDSPVRPTMVVCRTYRGVSHPIGLG